MIAVHPHVAWERARGWLLAFDPGMRYPAAALFFNGVLVCAQRIKVPKHLHSLDDGERARQIAELTYAWAMSVTKGAPINHTVIECPQVYSFGKSKGDPNDLIKLALVAGAVASKFGASVVAPVPRDWIGQIPKSTTGDPRESARGKIFVRRLTALELLAVELTHDAFDAAGIGLWALGRLAKVYSAT